MEVEVEMEISMERLLEYPFDANEILKKKKRIKKELLQKENLLQKKIAILGGSTTSEIKDILELFLLHYGIRSTFYESEFGQFWQDAMFDNAELDTFAPDLIYIHTSNRNILQYPSLSAAESEVNDLLETESERFCSMWDRLKEKYACPIIQNNFELPAYRLLGNREASDIHGRIYFLNCLNMKFYEYARTHEDLYINDIQYLSASYGLEQWSDPLFWHMYKYSLCLPAIPYLALNVANIIKAIYGKNKKALVLDLDNTLWGGVIGDDGTEGIAIGHETSMGQVYSEFQEYLKSCKEMGIMLNVDSKNEEENVLAGLNHPEGTLRPEDFIVIKANWEPKDRNFTAISEELNILPESMVFIDDNPAEREIVRAQIPGVSVPELDRVEDYIRVIDRSGFFEVTELSEDDFKRNSMYRENAKRKQQQKSFSDYGEYLRSLEMKAVIRDFDTIYLPRIAQLTNKSNQFNLTTKRLSEAEIESLVKKEEYIRLYGKLSDKFGDNGVVTVVIGRQEEELLHIELWLMSCRVLKRGMEDAMLDELVKQSKARKIKRLKGYYYKTAKNAMVKEFYGSMGFEKISENSAGDSEWILELDGYRNRNQVIGMIN